MGQFSELDVVLSTDEMTRELWELQVLTNNLIARKHMYTAEERDDILKTIQALLHILTGQYNGITVLDDLQGSS